MSKFKNRPCHSDLPDQPPSECHTDEEQNQPEASQPTRHVAVFSLHQNSKGKYNVFLLFQKHASDVWPSSKTDPDTLLCFICTKTTKGNVTLINMLKSPYLAPIRTNFHPVFAIIYSKFQSVWISKRRRVETYSSYSKSKESIFNRKSIQNI